MRDRYGFESELPELRAVADALDGSLGRLAAGDIYQQIETPFPRSFDGMRRDFNRGLVAIRMSIDEIASRAHEIRCESTELRHGLRQAAEDGERNAATVSGATVSLAAAADASRSQVVHAGHIATILNNARTDLDRPRLAAAAAGRDLRQAQQSLSRLKDLVGDVRSVLQEASLLSLDGGSDTAGRLRTLTQQAGATVEAISDAADRALQAVTASADTLGQMDREIDALDLYVDAAGSQVRALGESTQRQEALMEAIRADLAAFGRREDSGDTAQRPPQFHLDAIDRAAAEIDRQTDRFAPAQPFTPPFTPAPQPGKGSHLRLVKP